MNILERYEHLTGERGRQALPEVVHAHETEMRAALWTARWIESRRRMQAFLVGSGLHTQEELVASGLTELPNPRQLLVELSNAISKGAGSALVHRLLGELECTLEPLLERLPEPQD